MSARYEVFEDDSGEWRWRLISANGEVVAASEGYTRREDAHRGALDARQTSAEAVQVRDEAGA